MPKLPLPKKPPAVQSCKACGGTGKASKRYARCPVCRGEGYLDRKEGKP